MKMKMKEERWGKMLAVLIQICRFVWVNPDITAASFPFSRGSLFNAVEILSLKDRLRELNVPTLTAAEIETWICDLGFRPANLPEFLHWWFEEEDEKRWTDATVVVALGSKGLNRGGAECSPYIYCWNGGPKLGLYKCDYAFIETFGIAVVRM
jgi:hypothetical protein